MRQISNGNKTNSQFQIIPKRWNCINPWQGTPISILRNIKKRDPSVNSWPLVTLIFFLLNWLSRIVIRFTYDSVPDLTFFQGRLEIWGTKKLEGPKGAKISSQAAKKYGFTKIVTSFMELLARGTHFNITKHKKRSFRCI